LGDLVGDLVLVLTPVFGVEKFEIGGCAIITDEEHSVTEAIGAIEDVAFVEVVEDSFKFFGAELGVVVFFELGFEVGGEVGGVADGDRFVAESL
jgi:hypothetical protein